MSETRVKRKKIVFPSLDNITLDSKVNDIVDPPPKLIIKKAEVGNFNIDNVSLYKDPKNKQISEDYIIFIKKYSGGFYTPFNDFIRTNKLKTYKQSLKTIYQYDYLDKFLFETKRESMEDTETLLYYYYMGLYNSIKHFPRLNVPFKTLRGVDNFMYYMREENKTYYLTDFLSTTNSLAVAAGYSYTADKNKENKFNIINFIIYPNCEYAYIKDYSLHPDEEEILLSPYNRYLYIKQKDLEEDELEEYIESDPHNKELYNNFYDNYMKNVGVNMGYFLVLPCDKDLKLSADDIKKQLKGQSNSFGNSFGNKENVIVKKSTSKERDLVNYFKNNI